VTHIVEECSRPDNRLVIFAYRDRVFGFAKERQRSPRQVISPQRVLESRVCGAWIYQVRPAKLADVSQPLKDLGVDELEGEIVDADVVPERVAQNLEARASLASLGPR
jgi:hypothetical protein